MPKTICPHETNESGCSFRGEGIISMFETKANSMMAYR